MSRRTPITITIGDTVLDGQLSDNATAQDLIATLPLTLEFRDFNGVEKIGRLPKKLTMDDVPKGDDPEPNDIGYYAPTNDLVFYYDDVGYWDGIVRLGVFDSDLSIIRNEAQFTATIERTDLVRSSRPETDNPLASRPNKPIQRSHKNPTRGRKTTENDAH